MRKSPVPPDPELITPEVAALLEKAKAGSRDAVQDLYRHYEPIFRRVIRRRIAQRLRTIMESDDFMQDVGLRLNVLNLPSSIFESPTDFIAYVSKVAENRVFEENRKYLVLKKHSLWREVHVREFHDPPAQESEPYLTDEEWDVIVLQAKPAHQPVLSWFRDGWTPGQVGQMVGMTEWGVSRILRNELASFFELPQLTASGLFD